MANPRDPALEVHEQPAFTRRFGKFQRVGWGLMTLIVLAALSGVTGAGGPASRIWSGAADVPAVMRVGRPDHLILYRGTERDRAGLNLLAGDWLDVEGATLTGPSADRIAVSVTPRRVGIARFRIPTGPGTAADVALLILP